MQDHWTTPSSDHTTLTYHTYTGGQQLRFKYQTDEHRMLCDCNNTCAADLLPGSRDPTTANRLPCQLYVKFCTAYMVQIILLCTSPVVTGWSQSCCCCCCAFRNASKVRSFCCIVAGCMRASFSALPAKAWRSYAVRSHDRAWSRRLHLLATADYV